jgi:hypothetical protein
MYVGAALLLGFAAYGLSIFSISGHSVTLELQKRAHITQSRRSSALPFH